MEKNCSYVVECGVDEPGHVAMYERLAGLHHRIDREAGEGLGLFQQARLEGQGHEARAGLGDAQAELARLGLDEHLSSQRSNGLRAMIQRIRQLSADAA